MNLKQNSISKAVVSIKLNIDVETSNIIADRHYKRERNIMNEMFLLERSIMSLMNKLRC